MQNILNELRLHFEEINECKRDPFKYRSAKYNEFSKALAVHDKALFWYNFAIDSTRKDDRSEWDEAMNAFDRASQNIAQKSEEYELPQSQPFEDLLDLLPYAVVANNRLAVIMEDFIAELNIGEEHFARPGVVSYLCKDAAIFVPVPDSDFIKI